MPQTPPRCADKAYFRRPHPTAPCSATAGQSTLTDLLCTSGQLREFRAYYRGKDKGKGWVEKSLGWTVELVEWPRKPASKEVLMAWAKQWAKEGVAVDWERLLPPRGFIALPRRWVVERTFAWLCHNRRMSKDYERLCATSEAFIYVAMSRLMVRRLARA